MTIKTRTIIYLIGLIFSILYMIGISLQTGYNVNYGIFHLASLWFLAMLIPKNHYFFPKGDIIRR